MAAEGFYIVDRPTRLTERASAFLLASSRRVDFERGLTGESLQRQIAKVYGSPNDVIVNLLDRLQARYGGLSYESGFFNSAVTFAPACDLEDPRMSWKSCMRWRPEVRWELRSSATEKSR